MATLSLCFPPPRLHRVFTGMLSQRLNISQVSIPGLFQAFCCYPRKLGLKEGPPFPWAQL